MHSSGRYLHQITAAASRVKPVWNDHPWCQENMVFPDRWSFQTGSVCMESSGRQNCHKTGNGLSRQGGLSRRGSFQTGFTIQENALYFLTLWWWSERPMKVQTRLLVPISFMNSYLITSIICIPPHAVILPWGQVVWHGTGCSTFAFLRDAVVCYSQISEKGMHGR